VVGGVARAVDLDDTRAVQPAAAAQQIDAVIGQPALLPGIGVPRDMKSRQASAASTSTSAVASWAGCGSRSARRGRDHRRVQRSRRSQPKSRPAEAPFGVGRLGGPRADQRVEPVQGGISLGHVEGRRELIAQRAKSHPLHVLLPAESRETLNASRERRHGASLQCPTSCRDRRLHVWPAAGRITSRWRSRRPFPTHRVMPPTTLPTTHGGQP
jgi:hypothetical protein